MVWKKAKETRPSFFLRRCIFPIAFDRHEGREKISFRGIKALKRPILFQEARAGKESRPRNVFGLIASERCHKKGIKEIENKKEMLFFLGVYFFIR